MNDEHTLTIWEECRVLMLGCFLLVEIYYLKETINLQHGTYN